MNIGFHHPSNSALAAANTRHPNAVAISSNSSVVSRRHSSATFTSPIASMASAHDV